MSEPSHSFIAAHVPVLLMILLVAAVPLRSQTTQQPASGTIAPQSDPDRKQALQLIDGGKMVQAMPLFEKLCAAYPKDPAL